MSYDNDHGFKVNPGEYLVTEPGHPDEMMDTQYGRVPYKHWLQLESRRFMEQNMRDSWLRVNPEGLVALVSLRDYQKPVQGKE